MKTIFADTSYWTALVNPRDQIHDKAIAVTEGLSSTRLVTTEMVLAELLNSFSESPFRNAVGGMVERLRGDRNLTIVPQTAEQFAGALHRYRRAPDKRWSLTDCASFAVMETGRIDAALTYDRHFVQAGFEALLRS
jgi:predicted nucleic acid-binding protein